MWGWGGFYILTVNTAFLSRWVKVLTTYLSFLNYSNGPRQGEMKLPHHSWGSQGTRKETSQILSLSFSLWIK